MKKALKKSLFFILCLTLMSVLSACGGDNDELQETTSLSSDTSDNYNDFMDDEFAETNENEEDEVISSGSIGPYVPADQFWHGDDYFDIVGFLEANSANVTLYDMGRDQIDYSDPSPYGAYIARFDDKWDLEIRDGYPLILAQLEPGGRGKKTDISYEISSSSEIPDPYKKIDLDAGGHQTSEVFVFALEETVKLLVTNINSDDPLASSTGLYYH